MLKSNRAIRVLLVVLVGGFVLSYIIAAALSPRRRSRLPHSHHDDGGSDIETAHHLHRAEHAPLSLRQRICPPPPVCPTAAPTKPPCPPQPAMYSGDVPIAPARVDDPMWWPFRRNAVVQTATATPDGVKPYKIYVHDRTICQFISGGIMSTGQWEPDLTRTLLGKLGPASNGRVFLDIGANLGWFSLAAAAAGHRVIAIDALHTNVELLMRSIHDNSAFAPLIEVYNYAVSSSGGTVAVMRPAPLGAPEVNKANGQIQFGAQREAEALKATDTVFTQHVNVTTIDAIVAASAHMRRDPLARIDVIKLDIEGFEARGLFGAMRLLDQHRPCFIVAEFVKRHITSTTAGRMIHDLLMSEGYKVNGHAPSEEHTFGQSDMDIYATHTDARCAWA